MTITITNTLKRQEGWYQSFQILPSIGIFKSCDSDERRLFISWLFISIGFDV
jgi:hypothetical protein